MKKKCWSDSKGNVLSLCKSGKSISFHRFTELHGSIHVKLPLRISVTSHIEKKKISMASFGQYQLVFILLNMQILIEYKVIHNTLMN